MRSVSESLAPLLINVALSASRRAEREHPMVFRLQQSTTSAAVEPFGRVENPFFDALFGTRDHPDGHIQEEFVLQVLVDRILSRRVDVRHDLRIEDEECLTIRIHAVDVPGRLELFECNEEGSNYFCEHTICIQDDDGKDLACNSSGLSVNVWNVHCRAVYGWFCGDDIHS